ncbi:MAG TPA: pentapeptide repeat-containing protein [Allocoleopsis sp.]
MLGVAIGGIGGTTFQGADLTDSSFNKAILKGTNFAGSYRQPTILARVCWAGAQKLEHARVGNSILASTFVRELLVTSNGYKKSFVNADLRGANLNGVNLNKANLKRADLSEATLQQANLAQANLTEVQAIGTNFTGATFTGACLEAWNIDYTTQLDQIDCQYVYLLEHANELGNRERRPHDPNSVFAPGDFTKLYTKIINSVEILLRNGVNREAFAEAFQKLMQENPEISFDSIQSIEKKGDDVLLTLTVPENSDKAKISQDFLKPYEERIRQLEAKVDELQTLRSTDLKDIALALANQSLNITNQAVGEGKAVQGNNDSSRKLNIGSIGGDFNASGQALNFGEMNISGQVTNTINQLPASSQPDEPGIKELLEQLHRAIESAEELKPEDKAEALKQVQALAEAGKDPAEPEKKNGAKSAIRWLKGMLTELAEPSAIVQLCKHVLPQIAGIFGL